MGNSSQKKKPLETKTKLGKEIPCPLCSKIFSKSTTYAKVYLSLLLFQFNVHIKSCAQVIRGPPGNDINIGENVNTGINPNQINNEPENTQSEQNNKPPKHPSPQVTKNIITKIPKISGVETSGIAKKLNFDECIKNHFPFSEKIKILRKNLDRLKVDWRVAHCNLELTRDNVLQQSTEKIQTVDLFKELKINFAGEVSHDAGGIIREWFYVVIKELQSAQLGLFERGETDDFTYLIKKNITISSEIFNYFNFLGKLIAKALLDNITLNLCFNKIIYKLILNEEIKFEDLVFIDKPLYNSLKELKKMNLKESGNNLCLFYVVEYRDNQGKIVRENLKINGDEEQVTDIDDYIDKRINHIISKQKLFVDQIKNSLFEYIPEYYLTIFTSDELDLLLNGQPFIDVEDWRSNTMYQGKYNSSNTTVKLFWQVLMSLSQEELSKFLQFCTGSSRVPIGGFGELESNRGEVAKFCIVPVECNTKQINFIKAHTCFNRIDLPSFTTLDQMRDAIGYIVNNEILGFGID